MSIFFGRGQQLLDETNGYGFGFASSHQQTINAVGTIHAPPAITRQIQSDKKVVWKQGRGCRLEFPGVASTFQKQRQKDPIVLVLELPRCLGLAVYLRMYDIPFLINLLGRPTSSRCRNNFPEWIA